MRSRDLFSLITFGIFKLKKRSMKNINIRTVFACIASLAVIVVAVIGFALSGTPQEQRLRRTDQQRIMDLQSISSSVDQYWYLNRQMPLIFKLYQNNATSIFHRLMILRQALHTNTLKPHLQRMTCAHVRYGQRKRSKQHQFSENANGNILVPPRRSSLFPLGYSKDKFAAPFPVSIE